MKSLNKWEQAQSWEAHWHDTVATNSYFEEMKQLTYAKKMGIEIYPTPYTLYNFKNYGKVLDIGGGDCSMLLKVEGKLNGCVVIDPCDYAKWSIMRYKHKGIKFIKMKGEDLDLTGFDEVWIYNCLQHTEDPEKICYNAKNAGKLIRIFEWVETPINEGHIHTLTKKDLDKWLGAYGRVETLNADGCFGPAYYAIVQC